MYTGKLVADLPLQCYVCTSGSAKSCDDGSFNPAGSGVAPVFCPNAGRCSKTVYATDAGRTGMLF